MNNLEPDYIPLNFLCTYGRQGEGWGWREEKKRTRKKVFVWERKMATVFYMTMHYIFYTTPHLLFICRIFT